MLEKLELINALQAQLKKTQKAFDPSEAFNLSYTYHSNAIEGNTLSLEETRTVLAGFTIGGKSLKEHFEALNHHEALGYIHSLTRRRLSEKIILHIHRLILKNINDSEAGRYRRVGVMVGGFIPPQPYLIAGQMQAFLNHYSGLKIHPVLKASLLHLEFVRIHPFIDGNGRTARLLMNLELLKNALPPVNILFEKREEYYRAIRAYTNEAGSTEAFDELLISYLLKTLKKANPCPTPKSKMKKS